MRRSPGSTAPATTTASWAKAITRAAALVGLQCGGAILLQIRGHLAATCRASAGRADLGLGRLGDPQGPPVSRQERLCRRRLPPGSKNLLYQGLQPDVFEPGFEKAYVEMVRKQAAGKDAWSWALIPEEADYLFGINSLTHDHMGYVVAVAESLSSPGKPRRPGDRLRRPATLCEVRPARFPPRPLPGNRRGVCRLLAPRRGLRQLHATPPNPQAPSWPPCKA